MISVLFLAAGSVVLSGQDKGSMYVSGSVSVSGGNVTSLSGGTSVKTPGVFELGVSPQFGYFVSDNWEIHLGVGYSYLKEPSFGDDGSTKASLWSLSPGVSYYACIVDGSPLLYPRALMCPWASVGRSIHPVLLRSPSTIPGKCP